MELSNRYHEWPNDFLAYEILNEPIAKDAKDWNVVLNKCIKAIRSKEPNRFIIVGSNMWQQASSFPYLEIPNDDRNLILSFHFYTPFALTHYRAYWVNNYSSYDGSINYPGEIVSEDFLKALPEGSIKQILKGDFFNNKQTLRLKMEPAIAYAKEHNLQLYCGEWGAMNTLPRNVRLNWYRDIIKIFNEEGISNATWSYKADLGIRSNDGTKIDDELICILIEE
jgi:endoglucanase